MDAHGIRTADAIAGGMSRSAVYGTRLHRPFYGMRTVAPPEGHVALCHAATVVLSPDTCFSHRSAAMIHMMPLPRRAIPSFVEVAVFEPARPPKLRGVIGHQLTPADHRLQVVDGLRVMSPQDAWAQLSSILPLPDLVAIGDMLITGDEPYSGTPPRIHLEDLEAAVRRHGRRRGVRTLRLALERVCYGSVSPQESKLRLASEDAGLARPSLNHRVVGPPGDGRVGMVDLAYPDPKVAIEYLGDHHRTDVAAYRNDIRRREWLVDLGWDVIFVTGDDDFADVARRTRRALQRSLNRASPSSTPL